MLLSTWMPPRLHLVLCHVIFSWFKGVSRNLAFLVTIVTNYTSDVLFLKLLQHLAPAAGQWAVVESSLRFFRSFFFQCRRSFLLCRNFFPSNWWKLLRTCSAKFNCLASRKFFMKVCFCLLPCWYLMACNWGRCFQSQCWYTHFMSKKSRGWVFSSATVVFWINTSQFSYSFSGIFILAWIDDWMPSWNNFIKSDSFETSLRSNSCIIESKSTNWRTKSCAS